MRRTCTRAASVIALTWCLQGAGVASAQSPALTPPPPPETVHTPSERLDYRWQLLTADAMGLALGLGIGLSPIPSKLPDAPNAISTTGALWYGVGSLAGPSIHFANGNQVAGFGSLALRLLTPPLASLGGVVTVCTSRRFRNCTHDGFSSGFLLGTAGAAVMDAFLLAKAPTPQARRWYGWQTLLVDAGGLGLGTYVLLRAQNSSTSSELPILPMSMWVGLYLIGTVGAPIVHFAHGRWLVGLGDLGLRLFAPVGVLVGLGGACLANPVGKCSTTGAAFGLLWGSLAAAVVDAGVFAFSPEPVARRETPEWLPVVSVTSDQATVGVAAAF